MPLNQFNNVNKSWPYRLRGNSGASNHQTTAGLLYAAPTFGNPAVRLDGMAVAYFDIENRSAATVFTGVFGRLHNRFWIAGQVNAAGTLFTDDTADAQSVATSDFPLEIANSNNSGFIVAARKPFSAITINVGTAGAAGAPAHSLAYSNAAGTGWTTMPANETLVFDASATHFTNSTNGESIIVWDTPIDWGVTATTLLPGLPSGYYAIQVLATTAPTGTAASATAIELLDLRIEIEGLTDNTLYEYAPNRSELRFDGCDGCGVFISTADAGNRATIDVHMLT